MIFSVGIDIVEIKRIKTAYIQHGKKLLDRIFTEKEQESFNKANKNFSKLATRFAAKEAVSKAFRTGIGKIYWKDIEILNENNGAPYVNLHGKALELFKKLGLKNIHISLSHSQNYGMAVCILEK